MNIENAQKLLPLELLLLAQICTKWLVGWGFAPDPLGELTSLPRQPSWFRGGAHGEREGGREGEKEGGEEREGKGREGKGGRPGMPKSRVGKPT